MKKVFRILSIDGGGIRGIYSARVLDSIEKYLKVNLFEEFDLIAGTSTGSIITSCLATKALSISGVVDWYRYYGNKIFNKKIFRLKYSLKSLYDSKYLESILSDTFKDYLLSDLNKSIVIPSTDLVKGGMHIFYGGKDLCLERDKDVLLKDAILASCSAPVYFEPCDNIDDYVLVDGGLWANNPSLVAILGIKKLLNIDYDEIHLLSIGTGRSTIDYSKAIQTGNWGTYAKLKQHVYMGFLLSLQEQSVMNCVNMLLGKENIKRIDFVAEKLLLLDDISKIDWLVEQADRDFHKEYESIKEFFYNSKNGKTLAINGKAKEFELNR